MSDGMQDYYMEGSAQPSNSGVPADPLDFLTQNTPAQPSISPTPSSRPLNTNLSEDERLAISKKIQDIFDSEPPDEDEVMADDDDEEEEVIDVEDQERRTDKLKNALSPLAQLWWSGSEHIDLVTEKLADGSRASMSFNPELSLRVHICCVLFLTSSTILSPI